MRWSPAGERFNQRVTRTDGCWLWDKVSHAFGYGHFSVNGKRMYAHRASWVLYVGAIPDGLCVLHKCDNPRCVNPAHLFLGTKRDNIQDQIAKGRTWQRLNPERVPRGAGHHMARITADVVREIRTLRSIGWTLSRLAERFHLSQSHLSEIALRKSWSHI